MSLISLQPKTFSSSLDLWSVSPGQWLFSSCSYRMPFHCLLALTASHEKLVFPWIIFHLCNAFFFLPELKFSILHFNCRRHGCGWFIFLHRDCWDWWVCKLVFFTESEKILPVCQPSNWFTCMNFGSVNITKYEFLHFLL